MKISLTQNEQEFESMIEKTDLGAALDEPVMRMFASDDRHGAFDLLIKLHPIFTPATYPLTFDAWQQLMIDRCRCENRPYRDAIAVSVTPVDGATSYQFYRKIGE